MSPPDPSPLLALRAELIQELDDALAASLLAPGRLLDEDGQATETPMTRIALRARAALEGAGQPSATSAEEAEALMTEMLEAAFAPLPTARELEEALAAARQAPARAKAAPPEPESESAPPAPATTKRRRTSSPRSSSSRGSRKRGGPPAPDDADSAQGQD